MVRTDILLFQIFNILQTSKILAPKPKIQSTNLQDLGHNTLQSRRISRPNQADRNPLGIIQISVMVFIHK